MKYDVNDIPGYLDAIPEDRVETISEILNIIREVAPKAKELFKHGMPFYTLEEKPLFAVASQKHFMAVYNTEFELVKKYKGELGKVNMGKSCIRFSRSENIDVDALTRLLVETYEKRLKHNIPHSAR